MTTGSQAATYTPYVRLFTELMDDGVMEYRILKPVHAADDESSFFVVVRADLVRPCVAATSVRRLIIQRL